MAVLYFPLSPQTPLHPSADVLGASFLEKLEAIRPNLPVLLLCASAPCLSSCNQPKAPPTAWTLDPSPPAGLGPLLQEVSCFSQHQHLLPFCLIVLFCTHTHVLITSCRKEREGRKEGGKEEREEGRKKKRKEGGREGKHTTASVKVLAGKQNSCRGFN